MPQWGNPRNEIMWRTQSHWPQQKYAGKNSPNVSCHQYCLAEKRTRGPGLWQHPDWPEPWGVRVCGSSARPWTLFNKSCRDLDDLSSLGSNGVGWTKNLPLVWIWALPSYRTSLSLGSLQLKYNWWQLIQVIMSTSQTVVVTVKGVNS